MPVKKSSSKKSAPKVVEEQVKPSTTVDDFVGENPGQATSDKQQVTSNKKEDVSSEQVPAEEKQESQEVPQESSRNEQVQPQDQFQAQQSQFQAFDQAKPFDQNQGRSFEPQGKQFHRVQFRPMRPQMSTPRYGGMDQGPTEEVKGILEVQPEGHGFLRPKFTPSSRDIYISQSQIRKFMLRAGDLVKGVARPPKDTERYYGLLKVEMVNDVSAEESLRRPYFDDLTPIYPKKQVVLATGKTPLSTRMIDLIAPIGFGQRGMIVSPPKAGKTTILKEIAAGISQNFPKVHLMAALIGERPEEVTDLAQSIKGDVVASHFDEPPENQTRVAEITLDRAKRLVEKGIDVIILLDSVTRLARAYNLAIEPSGRTLSGGFDPAALWPAKKFFGAARNCQEGGSLTIIGTALVETGSRMDDLIYEEFKGTGNMELHLDRRLADKRIFPAINIERSGTRQEELLLSQDDYKKIVTMRRMLDMLNSDERTALFIEQLSKTEKNQDFLETLGKGA